MSKFEPKSPKGSVPNGQSLFAMHDAIWWFKCKLKPPNNTGADANLMPIHHFRTIFPYLCDSSGQPKEGVLEKAESSFESYSGDSVTVIGQTKIYAKNKQTQQFLITRIYVIARERGPILLGSAACQWLGLIAMLCENKAPVVGRFVASITREETDAGEVEAYPIPKTGDGTEMTES